jgi:hypothetical protein
LISHIDQRITERVTEQQKIDAKRAHDKSELEQLKQDIANANKQKQFISTALENKVHLDCQVTLTLPLADYPFFSIHYIIGVSILIPLSMDPIYRKNHLQMSGIK